MADISIWSELLRRLYTVLLYTQIDTSLMVECSNEMQSMQAAIRWQSY